MYRKLPEGEFRAKQVAGGGEGVLKGPKLMYEARLIFPSELRDRDRKPLAGGVRLLFECNFLISVPFYRYKLLPNRQGGVSGFGVPPASRRPRNDNGGGGGGWGGWGRGHRLGNE